MNYTKYGFLLLAVLAILLAGFLTWNLMSPKEAAMFYETTVGIQQHEPTNEAIGRATVHFKKTEE